MGGSHMRPGARAALRFALWAIGMLAPIAPRPVSAQVERIKAYNEVYVGSELEEYIRFLSSAQDGERHPWSIRGFSPGEIDAVLTADSTHPWAERFELFSPTGTGARVDWVRPEVRSWYNSAFPSGENDGPVWVGRGLTTAVQAGFSAGLGPLSISVRPVAFWTQNRKFDLPSETATGLAAYQQVHGIDLPFRFGDEPYARVDPGESSIQVKLPGVSAGFSTASQAWGPAGEHPLVLGGNAGGFPHLFVGSSEPVNVWVGRVHGRISWGKLDQSEFSPVRIGEKRRLVAGVVGVFQPRGLDGLELGATRFINSVWPEGGPGTDDLLRPFAGVFKVRLDNVDLRLENQIASVFARWVLPRSGFEVYSEFVREDYSTDSRHLILEPDDLAGYMLGLRKVWHRPDSRYLTLRAEVLNTETAHRERNDRGQKTPLYQHTAVRQGHTQRGQLLASASGYGGAGSILASDYYHPGGRWTVEWRRSLQEESAGAFDVSHALGLNRLWFRGRFDVEAEIAAVYNLNRYFRGDVLNMRAMLGIRTGL